MKNKIILFTLLLQSLFFNSKAQDFITRWNTGSSSLSFSVETSGPVNYTWESVPAGSSGSGSFSGNSAMITLPQINLIVRLKIDTTNFRRIYDVSTTYQLIDIEQWGGVSWSSMESAFRNCNSLNISATDVPNLTNVSSMRNMFRNCINLNAPTNINNWNTSNVTNMEGMFSSASEFNQPIGNWNTSNVTEMSYMFQYAYAFNQPIGNWNTSNVIKMGSMFYRDSSFNQPIGNWNTSNVNNMSEMFYSAIDFNQPIGNWDVSNVTNMLGMFRFTEVFNQPIDNWDVRNVTDMRQMFYGASDFNQPLGNWKLNSNVTTNSMLLLCGMDCSSYSATLYGWANNPNIPSNKAIDGTGRKYSPNIVLNRDFLINTKGWIFQFDSINSVNCFYPAEIENINGSSQIAIFPNPTNGLITISNYISSISKLEIVNLQGQKILENKLKDNIDISALPQGVYFLYISNEKGEKYVKKVIRE